MVVVVIPSGGEGEDCEDTSEANLPKIMLVHESEGKWKRERERGEAWSVRSETMMTEKTNRDRSFVLGLGLC